MTWITFIVYFSVVIWFLFDKAIDKETPKIVANIWKITIASLAILIITSTALSVILSDNIRIAEMVKTISSFTIPVILILRLNLLIVCSISKVYYNRKRALYATIIGRPIPYDYQPLKYEVTKWKKRTT